MSDPARFITFEGGEGAGKSTQAARLSSALTGRGIANIVTREPGGSPGAEQIRKLLVEGEPGRWDAVTETLLLFAARADHVARTIRPALDSVKWVICDRFTDSTYAYQGAGRGVAFDTIARIRSSAIGEFGPDLTLVLDVPPDVAMNRIGSRTHAETRFEKFDSGFHARLRQSFRDLARREPDRCVLIDASATEDPVAAMVWRAVSQRFGI
jgi:dTMP kinase